MMYDLEIAEKIATELLSMGAVSLSPTDPYTWASGLRSPIYCDNRTTLAYPKVRNLIANSMAKLIKEIFPQTEVIAGTATAGIPHAALVADRLQLPMAYVRSTAKDHGKGNQIEGQLKSGQQVILIEDLISTGGSVLQAGKAVNMVGAKLLGVVAIFNYELEQGKQAFASYQTDGLPLYTLSNFPTLIKVAQAQGNLSEKQAEGLSTWSSDPQNWWAGQ